LERFICIHGHFYQPPRENPWLDMVELQDSAYPYHDWNERITAECYGPNAVARILGPDGRIERLVNNYARMSFDVGPTLLRWMRDRSSDVYQAILDADRDSQQRYGGHGSALAQAYHHVILPLSHPADRVTEVVWGIRDFEHVFGREPEGMWLPECAVDIATLEVLAAHGIRFAVLTSHQAARVRPRQQARSAGEGPPSEGGQPDWQDVHGGRIDTSRAYLQKLPSGRSIALFFTSDAINREVAFGPLLVSGESLAGRLLSAFTASDEPQLVHVASDGEAYGHHHTHGDMALAYALHHLEAGEAARLTNYGEFLDRFPPRWEVEVVENSSWSCAHGVERWRADCGCNSRRQDWRQQWRAPLRAALDELREAIRPLFEGHAGDLLKDPYAARNDYVRVLLDPGPEAQDRFLEQHARRSLDEPARVKVLELMELQRHALAMYTSCGWFFDEVSGLESTQILMSAGRALHLAEKLFGQPLEEQFLRALEQAPSNLRDFGTARGVYEKFVRPARVDRHNVGAHYAISSLFEAYPRSSRVFCYRVDRHDERAFEAGRVRMLLGHATLGSLATREKWDFTFAAIHFGDHNITGGVRAFPGADAYEEQIHAFTEAFARVDMPQMLRLMDRYFGESTHSVASLFRDEQRKVLKSLMRSGLAEAMALYSRVYEQGQPLMRFLKHLSVPLPPALRAATEVLFNTDLRWAFEDDAPDFDQIRQLVREAGEWGVNLDAGGLAYKFTRLLDRTAERWRDQPGQTDLLASLLAGVDLARDLPFEPNLWKPQNVYFELVQSVFDTQAQQSADGSEAARVWVEQFIELGEKLGVDVDGLKKKLTELKRRPSVPHLVAELSRGRRVPLATYRLQINHTFPFAQVTSLVDYLAGLGISDLYLSPILQARPGSMHGYDICDHAHVNPELGGEADLDVLVQALRQRGMGLIIDMVPNHMGIGHPSNRWWMDVLENGPVARHASYFDIDWDPVNPDLRGKVLLPTLGEQYGSVLESGQFRLTYEKGSFSLFYYDKQLPVAPRTYRDILASRLDYLGRRLGEQHDHFLEYRSILTALEHLPKREPLPPERQTDRYREVAIVKRRLAALTEASEDVRSAVESAVDLCNGKVGNPGSFDRLDALIAAQAYRPAFWRVAMDEINYRRFFDINDLAALRPERPEVFNATHEVVLRLLVEGKVAALRIDHPDGLHSPAEYFRRLQERYTLQRVAPQVEGHLSAEQVAAQVKEALDELAREGEAPAEPGKAGSAGASPSQKSGSAGASPCRKPWPLYVVAEKILGEREPLPADWAVDGTTGYDFLNLVNGLFVDGNNAAALDRVYASFVAEPPRIAELVRTCKRTIMDVAMASEINSLSHQLDRLAERNRRYRDFTLNNLEHALRQLIASLPVYRTYTTAVGQVSDRDRDFVEAATEEAKRLNPRTAEAVFDFLRDTLLLRNREQFLEADQPRLLEWVLRFQQVTGPVMAKGTEDTAFYISNRLVSLNEVGGDPQHLGISVQVFHEQNRRRQECWPCSMLATSTHDTKRSEDVRTRIDVLSELPEEWGELMAQWRQAHAGLVGRVDGLPAPSPNDQYLFYQSLVGTWPDEMDAEGQAVYQQRLVDYMIKAVKEAKVYTSWINPNEEYDQAVRSFVQGALADEPDSPFRLSLESFVARLAFFGRLNSLVQVLFKLTSPGVPDIYQGNELWDYSLVDPDNRRPVDYERRRKVLLDLRERLARPGASLRALVGELLANLPDGRIKLFVTQRTLALRQQKRELFESGRYVPVRASGQQADRVCAYVRGDGPQWVLVTGCIRPVRLTGGKPELPVGASWGDTFLTLPEATAGTRLRNVFTGEEVKVTEHDGGAGVAARDVMAVVPFGLWEVRESEG
jgi:(1->4)-alpha-D-glucan 1-alpha-D-glucosylmutase